MDITISSPHCHQDGETTIWGRVPLAGSTEFFHCWSSTVCSRQLISKAELTTHCTTRLYKHNCLYCVAHQMWDSGSSHCATTTLLP